MVSNNKIVQKQKINTGYKLLESIDANANLKWLLTNKGSTNLNNNLPALNTGAAAQFKKDVEILTLINADVEAKYLLTNGGSTALTETSHFNAAAAAKYHDAILEIISHCNTHKTDYCSPGGSQDDTSIYHICALIVDGGAGLSLGDWTTGC